MNLAKIVESDVNNEELLAISRVVETCKDEKNKAFVLEINGEIADAKSDLMAFARLAAGEEKSFEELVQISREKFEELVTACDNGSKKDYEKAKEFFSTVRAWSKEKETPTTLLAKAEEKMKAAAGKIKKFCGRRDKSIKTKTTDIRHGVSQSSWEKIMAVPEAKKLVEKYNVMCMK